MIASIQKGSWGRRPSYIRGRNQWWTGERARRPPREIAEAFSGRVRQALLAERGEDGVVVWSSTGRGSSPRQQRKSTGEREKSSLKQRDGKLETYS